MKTEQYIDTDLYECMTYLQVKKALESGEVFVKDSINYRSLQDELIPLDTWKKEKCDILRKINEPLFLVPVEKLIANLKAQLEAKYLAVNKNIASKKNKHIKVELSKDKKPTWKLQYQNQEEEVNNPFYDNLPTNNISDVIRFVASETDFMKHFIHLQPRYAKSDVTLEAIEAYMIGIGTGIGKTRITEISDMTLSELETLEKNFIRLDVLRKVNDSIVNKAAKLPIFKYYNLSDYGIHVSLDGQKVESKYLTIKARFSSKHFGLSKGVVSYTLVANYLPIYTMLIGANEHESHYVLDIVKHNTSDIEIAAISGDMHSINRVNFFLLYMFGYWFTPRLTSIYDRAEKNLVTFLDVAQYKDLLIKPSKQVDESLLRSEWENIQHILASLALKETTQSTIVKKLSSYKATDSTLKALIEFDKVIMSLYMLDYIDDVHLRSIVHRTLNRGEEFHQLRAAILKISGGKLIGRTEMELAISNECNRFLANCIIYFNASILSALLAAYKNQNKKMYEHIKKLSPIAWQHINMVGRFEFFTNQRKIDLGNLAANLIKTLDRASL